MLSPDTVRPRPARAWRCATPAAIAKGTARSFRRWKTGSSFAKDDLAYLANLCHNCGECLYACQYAPPHEFGINVPRTLAEVRLGSYEEYCWPRVAWPPRSGITAREGCGTAAARIERRAARPGGDVGRGPLAGRSGRRFLSRRPARRDGRALRRWPAPSPRSRLRLAASRAARAFRGPAVDPAVRRSERRTGSGLRDALTLRHLHGSGADCTSAEEQRSPWRRWFHHLTMYGFVLCFASTSVAALYHVVFGWRAPYGYGSLPVVLGTLGGAGLLIGPAGLFALRRRRDPALAIRRRTGWTSRSS